MFARIVLLFAALAAWAGVHARADLPCRRDDRPDTNNERVWSGLMNEPKNLSTAVSRDHAHP
jgi:hypothetical protein